MLEFLNLNEMSYKETVTCLQWCYDAINHFKVISIFILVLKIFEITNVEFQPIIVLLNWKHQRNPCATLREVTYQISIFNVTACCPKPSSLFALNIFEKKTHFKKVM